MESIVRQLTGRSEIVIVDGASSDDTEDVVRKFRASEPRIRYLRMAENSGVDRGYNACVEAARGRYCWFMSDDDLLNPGSLRTVLAKAEQGFGVIVVNAEDWNGDFSVRLNNGRLQVAGDRVYSPADLERLFVDTIHHLSFIPALVIRRDVWLSRERERYFGSWFAHIGVVFQDAIPQGAALVAEPLVAVRNENVSWAKRMFEIWVVRWPRLVWSFENISDASKAAVCPRNPAADWRTLLAYRARDAYSFGDYRRYLHPMGFRSASRLVAATISVLPPSLINAATKAYRKVRPHPAGPSGR